ncbi:MAG: hypothetical protein MZW92_53140 [Comamonadaceae bacterium]|nr:hypothetical protein [Comamonadaceae bacterium]
MRAQGDLIDDADPRPTLPPAQVVVSVVRRTDPARRSIDGAARPPSPRVRNARTARRRPSIWDGGPRVQRPVRQALRHEADLDAGGRWQGPRRLAGLRLRARDQRLAGDRAARLRHPRLPARSPGPALLPHCEPQLDYEFTKGYYGRATDRLYGRVTRLFMTPLLRAMKSVLGPLPPLEYLDSFRYPLAGECSMTTGSRAHQPHSRGLGPRGGRPRRGLPQLRAEADLPGRAGRELRPQAPGGSRRPIPPTASTAWSSTSRRP